MKKIFLGLIACILATTLVFAMGPTGKAGKSDVQHLYLVEKDPADWSVVEGGAWGKMRIKTDNFVFNGHGLEADTDYTLVYYKDPWNGATDTVNQCLGNAVANNGGNVHIAGDYDFSLIPEKGDTNAGAKIWLVPSSDVSCPTGGMIGWNPTEYLFEYDLI